jgi:hypothetical protein
MRPKDAYIQAGYGSRYTGADLQEYANKHCYGKAEQAHIVGYMATWLQQARISDIDNPAAAVSDVVRAFHKAIDQDNLTAAAALGRLRFQANGIAEKTQLTVEHVISDADLLKRITGGDEQKMGLLSSLLRPATFNQDPVKLLELAAEPEPADDA